MYEHVDLMRNINRRHASTSEPVFATALDQTANLPHSSVSDKPKRRPPMTSDGQTRGGVTNIGILLRHLTRTSPVSLSRRATLMLLMRLIRRAAAIQRSTQDVNK